MIKILDQKLVSKIAAGEVVERPASIVKELIENALDADATTITIKIEQGGKKLIQVLDNGIGIGKDDLTLSIHPHATSKISAIDDLFSFSTLGFRGEALASIVSVCEFSVAARPEGQESGYELTVGGTREEDSRNDPIIRPTAARIGTTVTCRNLFYNVPARQKFLKSEAVEFGHILNVFTTTALIRPEVRFTLEHNGRLVKQLIPAPLWENRMRDLLGQNFIKETIKIEFSRDSYSAHGYASAPYIAKAKPKHQYVFINKRPVKDFLILKACRAGFENLIMERDQPDVILNLTIDLKKVDVNVHPRKLEVRHENPMEVFAFMKAAVKRALSTYTAASPIFKATSVLENPFIMHPRAIAPQKTHYFSGYAPTFVSREKEREPQELFEKNIDTPLIETAIPFFGNPALNRHSKIIGQLHQSYLILEDEKGMTIIDQHAAAERINYEKLSKELKSHGSIKKQTLLIPLTLELSLYEQETIETYRSALDELGFEIDAFGGATYSLTAAPSFVDVHDPASFVREVIRDLSESEDSASSSDPRDRALKSTACRSAIKFGDSLTREEQEALVAALDQTPNNISCIHGRPVFYRLTLQELERIFRR